MTKEFYRKNFNTVEELHQIKEHKFIFIFQTETDFMNTG